MVGPGGKAKGPGRPRTKAGLAPSARPARPLKSLTKARKPSWEAFHVKNTQKGAVVWEARAVRFFPCAEGLPGDELWLVVARNVLDGEVKYFLSNAPADAPLEVLVHVAFSRDPIEKLFKESKGQVGLDHFEVQRYREVQLDPEMGPRERTRRLRKVLRRIAYWQASNHPVACSHRKKRLQRLRRLGIVLPELRKCFDGL